MGWGYSPGVADDLVIPDDLLALQRAVLDAQEATRRASAGPGPIWEWEPKRRAELVRAREVEVAAVLALDDVRSRSPWAPWQRAQELRKAAVEQRDAERGQQPA